MRPLGSRSRVMALGTAALAGALGIALLAPATGPSATASDRWVLDPAFGDDGRVVADPGSASRADGAVRRDDGRLVLVGSSRRNGTLDAAVAQFAPDGTPDPSFGDGGASVTALGPSTDLLRDVTVDEAGRLVAGGQTWRHGRWVGVAVRYLADGSLDASFGDDGVAFLDLGADTIVRAVTTDGQGRVVVAGRVLRERYAMLAARLDADGQLDVGFGDAGAVIHEVGSYGDGSDVVAVPGRVLVAGTAGAGYRLRLAVLALDEDGLADPTFGSEGLATASRGTEARGAALTVAGSRLIAAGSAVVDGRRQPTAAAFTADGRLDEAFGEDGVRSVAVGRWGTAADVVAHPDGGFVVAGHARVRTDEDFAALRLDADGDLDDDDFGAEGVITVAFGDDVGHVGAALPEPDGRVTLAGRVVGTHHESMAMARLHRQPREPSDSDDPGAPDDPEPPEDLDDLDGAEEPSPPDVTHARLAGSERVETAVQISRDRFGTEQAEAVVLARADEFADALAGAPLAAALDAPVLLTYPHELHWRTRDELARTLAPGGTVHVLGGTEAISGSVTRTLAADGFAVRRYGGQTRYETAIEIARDGLGNPAALVTATGMDFHDALIAGPVAASLDGAVLLTAGDRLSGSLAAYLDEHGEPPRVAVGHPAARATPRAMQLAGETDEATAATVATAMFAAPAHVGVASNHDYPDALAGSAALGALDGPILLTRPDRLAPEAIDYVRPRRWTLNRIELFGGTAALSDDVADDLRDAVR